ncbi:PAS domain S-box protein [Microcoleus sp. FACHB-831]|uniref:PAS domain S-box protein n=1 Tax=Microcoleus sp. FACHB-831 TaxID=2692827 RepID=UPI001684E40E|nr:PAS domain S-box protein [Microcoleus sp. FACHB-831]
MSRLFDAPSPTQVCMLQTEPWIGRIFNEIQQVVRSLDATSYELIYVNSAVEKIYGRQASEFYDNSELWLQAIDPSERSRVLESLARVLEVGTVETEYHIIRPDGETRLVRDKFWLIEDENGNAVRIDGIVTEIAEVEQCDRSSEIRKQADQEQQKFITLVESISDFIAIASLDGKVIYLNKAGEKLVGISDKEQALHTNLLQYFFLEDRACVEAYILPIVMQEGQWEGEMRFQHFQTGAEIFINLNVFTIKDKQTDKPLAIASIARDITEQKQAEEALRISEQRLSLALWATDNGLWDWNLVTNEVYFSPGWKWMLGYEVDELESHVSTWQKLMHPDDLPYAMEALNKHFEDSSFRYAIDLRMLTKSGEWKWILAQGKVVERDRDGKPLRMAGTHKDIAHRKSAEEELAQTKKFLSSVLENLPVAVAAKEAEELRFALWNSAAKDLFGFNPEEVLGKNDYDVFPKDQADFFTSKDRQVLNSGEVLDIPEEFIQLKQGGIAILHTKKTAILDANGKPQYLLAIAEDITERKQAEAALRQSQYQLQEAQRIAHIGNWEFDVATGQITWSDELFRIFNIEPGQPVPTYTEHLKLYYAEDSELLHQKVTSAITEGKSYETDLRIIGSEGSFRYINVRGEAIRNEQEQVVRVIGTVIDITDRKRAEQALRDKEQFLRTIYDGVEQLIFVVDVRENNEFRYAGWNPAAEKTIGISTADGYGKTPQQLFGGELGSSLQQKYANCLESGSTITYEERISRNEIETWWLITLNPMRDESGKISRLIGTSTNITQRKQAEATLSEREQFLRSIYEGVDLAIQVLDVLEGGEFRYTAFNPAMERKLLISPSQLLGKTLAEALPPELAHQVRQHCADCVEAGMTISFEDCHIVDGKDSWWQMSMTPLKNDEAEVSKLVATASNITARKQAQLALEQSEAQLRELAQQEALLNRLATQIRNSLNLDTILETTVHEIKNLFQIDRCLFSWYRQADLRLSEESEIQNFYWEVAKEAKHPDLPSLLGCYPHEQVGNLAKERIFRMGVLRADDVTTEPDPVMRQFLINVGYKSALIIPIKTLSGEFGVVSCSHSRDSRCWSDAEVQLLQAVCDQLAIALNQAELYTQSQESALQAQAKSLELQQTLQELQRTQTQLIQTEKMSSLGQMVAGVAHEINNPVNFIYGNLLHTADYTSDLLGLIQLYQEAYPQPTLEITDKIESIELDFLTEDLPKMLHSMEVGAERIREIVKSLRTFSRLDEADMKSVDIHENIDSTLMILLHRLKAQAAHPSIPVIKEYNSNLPMVECYAGSLNQVFMNILSNAIDAIDDFNETRSFEEIQVNPGKIWIITEILESNRVAIRIKDNGPGIPANVLPRLFDPFFTTKTVGKGTGLGLSISYQIVVERHRGDLRCISSPGCGTEFVIEIPLRQ